MEIERKKKKAEEQAKKNKPKKDLIDDEDHGDSQDVKDNANTKMKLMKRPKFTKDLDLAAEDIFEEIKKINSLLLLLQNQSVLLDQKI